MDGNSTPTRTQTSIFGSAIAVVKNLFTPDKLASRQDHETSIADATIGSPGLSITVLGEDFAKLNLDDSTIDSSGSFRSSTSRFDDSFKSSMSTLDAQASAVNSSAADVSSPALSDSTVVFDDTIIASPVPVKSTSRFEDSVKEEFDSSVCIVNVLDSSLSIGPMSDNDSDKINVGNRIKIELDEDLNANGSNMEKSRASPEEKELNELESAVNNTKPTVKDDHIEENRCIANSDKLLDISCIMKTEDFSVSKEMQETTEATNFSFLECLVDAQNSSGFVKNKSAPPSRKNQTQSLTAIDRILDISVISPEELTTNGTDDKTPANLKEDFNGMLLDLSITGALVQNQVLTPILSFNSVKEEQLEEESDSSPCPELGDSNNEKKAALQNNITLSEFEEWSKQDEAGDSNKHGIQEILGLDLIAPQQFSNVESEKNVVVSHKNESPEHIQGIFGLDLVAPEQSSNVLSEKTVLVSPKNESSEHVIQEILGLDLVARGGNVDSEKTVLVSSNNDSSKGHASEQELPISDLSIDNKSIESNSSALGELLEESTLPIDAPPTRETEEYVSVRQGMSLYSSSPDRQELHGVGIVDVTSPNQESPDSSAAMNDPANERVVPTLDSSVSNGKGEVELESVVQNVPLEPEFAEDCSGREGFSEETQGPFEVVSSSQKQPDAIADSKESNSVSAKTENLVNVQLAPDLDCATIGGESAAELESVEHNILPDQGMPKDSNEQISQGLTSDESISQDRERCEDSNELRPQEPIRDDVASSDQEGSEDSSEQRSKGHITDDSISQDQEICEDSNEQQPQEPLKDDVISQDQEGSEESSEQRSPGLTSDDSISHNQESSADSTKQRPQESLNDDVIAADQEGSADSNEQQPLEPLNDDVIAAAQEGSADSNEQRPQESLNDDVIAADQEGSADSNEQQPLEPLKDDVIAADQEGSADSNEQQPLEPLNDDVIAADQEGSADSNEQRPQESLNDDVIAAAQEGSEDSNEQQPQEPLKDNVNSSDESKSTHEEKEIDNVSVKKESPERFVQEQTKLVKSLADVQMVSPTTCPKYLKDACKNTVYEGMHDTLYMLSHLQFIVPEKTTEDLTGVEYEPLDSDLVVRKAVINNQLRWAHISIPFAKTDADDTSDASGLVEDVKSEGKKIIAVETEARVEESTDAISSCVTNDKETPTKLCESDIETDRNALTTTSESAIKGSIENTETFSPFSLHLPTGSHADDSQTQLNTTADTSEIDGDGFDDLVLSPLDSDQRNVELSTIYEVSIAGINDLDDTVIKSEPRSPVNSDTISLENLRCDIPDDENGGNFDNSVVTIESTKKDEEVIVPSEEECNESSADICATLGSKLEEELNESAMSNKEMKFAASLEECSEKKESYNSSISSPDNIKKEVDSPVDISPALDNLKLEELNASALSIKDEKFTSVEECAITSVSFNSSKSPCNIKNEVVNESVDISPALDNFKLEQELNESVSCMLNQDKKSLEECANSPDNCNVTISMLENIKIADSEPNKSISTGDQELPLLAENTMPSEDSYSIAAVSDNMNNEQEIIVSNVSVSHEKITSLDQTRCSTDHNEIPLAIASSISLDNIRNETEESTYQAIPSEVPASQDSTDAVNCPPLEQSLIKHIKEERLDITHCINSTNSSINDIMSTTVTVDHPHVMLSDSVIQSDGPTVSPGGIMSTTITLDAGIESNLREAQPMNSTIVISSAKTCDISPFVDQTFNVGTESSADEILDVEANNFNSVEQIGKVSTTDDVLDVEVNDFTIGKPSSADEILDVEANNFVEPIEKVSASTSFTILDKAKLECKTKSGKKVGLAAVLKSESPQKLKDAPRENCAFEISNVENTLSSPLANGNKNLFVNGNRGSGILKEINDNIVGSGVDMGALWGAKKPIITSANASKPFDSLSSLFRPEDFNILNTALDTSSCIARESLYVKYDPYCQAPTTDNTLFIDAMKSIHDPEQQTAPLAYISPEKMSASDKKEEELRTEINRLKNLYIQNEVLAEEQYKISLEKQTEFEAQYNEARMKLVSLEAKQNKLCRSLQSLTKSNNYLTTLAQEYHKTIEALNENLAKRRAEEEHKITALIADRDDYKKHLESAEAAFIDVLSKYEKSKQNLEELVRNQAIQERCAADLRLTEIRVDERLRTRENAAAEELATFERFAADQASLNSAEIMRMTAQLRKEELTLFNMQESLNKKTLENQKLAAICDDLIAGRYK